MLVQGKEEVSYLKVCTIGLGGKLQSKAGSLPVRDMIEEVELDGKVPFNVSLISQVVLIDQAISLHFIVSYFSKNIVV